MIGKMKIRKVGFKYSEANFMEFLEGFKHECTRHNFIEGINLAADLGIEPRKIFELHFCKEYYEHTRTSLASSAAFCQGMAAAYYLVHKDKSCSTM